MAISELISSLQGNPYFGAGFGLVGLTAILATGRKGAILAWYGIRRYAFVTCEVNSKGMGYSL
jgi:chaperone BCS1